ncbi:RDD family protein [Dawidia soli]|uniref:RDD family protein n=1 Tax=Dawidia soli TaxID=2782352 RepID=A0AAP2D8D0_9BACT|nr:RDD family protein [Dawidia soli]MBT1685920.1 RDD family protein [Dawidia soli]
MKLRTWVGLSVLALFVLNIAPDLNEVLYAVGVKRAPMIITDRFNVGAWGNPIVFNYYDLSEALTLVATGLLYVSALIFIITGRALKMLTFLCSLMVAHQGARLLSGTFYFILSPDKSLDNLQMIVPPLVMTAIGCGVLRIFQRTWDERSASGGYFVAAPIVRFYGYIVDLTIIQTLLETRPYSLDMSGYEWLVALMAYVLYYVLFEGLFHFTPGKLLLNTRVCMQNGTEPLWGTVVLRTLVRMIPFEPLSCLYNQGWHDEFSRTKVIRYPWAGGPVTTG